MRRVMHVHDSFDATPHRSPFDGVRSWKSVSDAAWISEEGYKKGQARGYGISRVPGPRLQPKSACNTNLVKLTAI